MKYILFLFLLSGTAIAEDIIEPRPSEILVSEFKEKCFANKDQIAGVPSILEANNYTLLSTPLRDAIVRSSPATHGETWGYSKGQIMIVGNKYLCQVLSSGQIGDIWFITGHIANNFPVIRGTSLVAPQITYYPYQLKDMPLGWVIIMEGPMVGISLVYHVDVVEE